MTGRIDDAEQDRSDARAAGVYIASRTIAMGLLVASLVLANHLYDAAGWQYVGAIVLIYETALALGSLGLPDAVFYFLGRYPERAGAIVRQTSAMLLIAAVPVIAIAIGVGAVMDAREPTLDLLPALPWLALVIVVELPTQPAVNQLIAHGKVGAASALYVAFAVLRTAAVLVPALTGWPLIAIPIAMAVLGATRLVAHVAIVRGVYPLAAGARWRDRAQMIEIVRFAIPAGLAATVGKLNVQLDKYVVTLMLGAAAFGVYTVAAFELPLITLIPYAIGAVMQVRYVRLYAAGDRDGLRRVWFSTVEKTAIIVVPLAVVVIVMARDLILLVFDDAYVAATAPFQVFTAILLHRVAAYGPMLQATNQTRVLFVTSISILVANLILSPPLTLAFGFVGPAIATALSYVPAWLLTLHRIGVALGGGIPQAMPWRHYATTLAVAGGLGGVLWLVRPALDFHPGANLAIAFGGYVIAYLAVGRAVGVLGAADTAYLRRVVTLGAWR